MSEGNGNTRRYIAVEDIVIDTQIARYAPALSNAIAVQAAAEMNSNQAGVEAYPWKAI